jgi:ESS family glutamate:Na+ symporter
MTSGFQFWDREIWSFIVTIALLLGGMLLANLLRRKIRFLRRSLIPSAVLGGFLILLLDSLFKWFFGHSMFSLSTLEALTYHGLGLGFVALAWRHLDGVKSKKARRDVFNTSTVTVGGYLIQALVGLLITLVFSYVLGSFAAGGLLLPMGYGQGPGQAFNWGNNYQNLYGFANGSSFGLTVAAMGFVSACVGGVYYLNKMRLAGDHRAQLENAEELEDLSAEHITGNGEIPLSESMDKLTVQFGYVFLTYLAAYGSMWLLYHFLLEPAGGFCMNTINPLLWGFNFLVGTAWAILFKGIGNKLRAKGIINRVYTNNFMLNRISGLMFDVMVVASIAAIDLSAFRHREFWLPLLLICLAGALITYWYVRWICKRLFPDYSDEMFLAMYGMLTGTASTGIILLREIDPLYRTPTSHNLIYQNLWSIVLGAPMLLLMGVAARNRTMTWVCFGICIALFAFILILQFRNTLFHKKEKS